ncbi:MAG: four helix bundle protein [Chloroflexi bacterium]|nr:four helix bundle protein [Chloroflexota bacterium]
MTGDKGLETLLVWQKSLAFAVEVCKTTLPKLPVQEKWSLVDQLRRSAQSIPANIAEGYGRFYFQESVRFCYIARGSLEETFSHLTLAHKLDYLDNETYKRLNDQIIELRRMISGYIAFLKESKRGASEPGANHHVREESSAYIANTDPSDS